ncbi:hypothetical protein HOV04_gp59 [Xanthomonas phage XcP1]|uniref:Uncharacterized protein n=1 Tax=Xanthomonas phage XcP1 TaxID=2785027 RepID=A0A3S7L8J1_9CAUD|nr:hypothetical protein HOV04_gp59 [Xanthomonas phage XcP1]AWN08561.1 hypothetical protein XcP1_059 [Xanthomonas phage XcP1]
MDRDYHEEQMSRDFPELIRNELGENAYQFKERITRDHIKPALEIIFIKSELDMTGEQMQRFQRVLAGIDRRFDIVMRRREAVK